MQRRQFIKYAISASAGALVLPELWSSPARARGKGSNVVLVPDTIAADGSIDVTGALASFIASVADGSTIRFPVGGSYRIEETLRVAHRNNLAFDGNDSTLFATTSGSGHGDANRSHLKFVGGSQITVTSLNITGANPTPGVYSKAYNSQHGILLAGVKGAVVTGCTISNVYGDSVYLGSEVPGRVNSPCEDIQVLQNIATGNGRQAMTVCYGRNVWFVGNTIDNSGLTIFDFEPNTIHTPCSGIHVIGNTVGTHGAVFLAAKGGAPVNDVTVSNNTSQIEPLGIQAGHAHRRQSGWVVQGNVSPVSGNSSRYYGFTNMDDITVTGNSIVVPDSAVRINDCATVRVTDNVFTGASTALDVLRPGDRFYQGPSSHYMARNNTL